MAVGYTIVYFDEIFQSLVREKASVLQLAMRGEEPVPGGDFQSPDRVKGSGPCR